MRADAPFVDRAIGAPEQARPLAERLAAALDLPRPTLMRVGMNAMFAAGGAVIRVGRPTAPAQLAYHLAEALRDAGVRVPVPYRPDAVLHDRDLAATAWELVPTVRAVEWHAVGVMLARLHRLDPDAVAGDYPVPAAASFPWWRFDELLQEARPLLDGPAHDALAASVERYSPWMDAAAHTAGAVLCHGDVHPGNVIGGPHGPVLLDWDLLCTAPPEWDHAPLLAMIARWGADARSYGELAAGYGADLSRRPLTMALRELRLVAATLMRVLAEGAPPRPDSEAALRLQYWRGDRGAPPWHLV